VTPFRNLIIHGVNRALASGQLSLEPGDIAPGHMFTSIGDRQSVVLWADAGAGEVRLSVWWDYDDARYRKLHSRAAIAEPFLKSEPLVSRASYPLFVGATASGWLERTEGRHLQGRGNRGIFGRYLRHSNLNALATLPLAIPDGFAGEGILYVKR